MTDGVIEGTIKSERLASTNEFGEKPTTISDVITKLNSTIRANVDVEALIKDQRHEKMKGFELHTRLPDGSARPASSEEIATADFQSKLQQAIATLQSLPDASKLVWAETQRVNVGNIYYEKLDYENAIDVYLTCLIAATPSPSPNPESKYTMEHLILYMKLMNNLALCTLQLRWYRKTITFCSIAIDQILITLPHVETMQLKDTDRSGDFAIIILEQRIKLHYKRAKAYRLRGEYDIARLDINRMKTELISYSSDNATHSSDSKSIELMCSTIVKEEQLLQLAIHRGNKNFKHHQAAMKLLLTQNDDFSGPRTLDVNIEQSNDNDCNETIQPLYYDHHNVNPKVQQKSYSNLRARKTNLDDKYGRVALAKGSAATTENKQIMKFQNYLVSMYHATLHFVRWLCHLIYFLLSFRFRSRKETKI